MKKIYTALLLVLLTAMFSVGVYSLADYDATGSASEKREFIKPEFSVKALLDGTYIPALERYYSDTFPGRESLLKANRTLNKFYYYSGSGADSVLILNQSDSAAQGGESLDAVQKANGQSPQPEQPTSAQPETTTEAPAEPVQVPTDTAGAPQTPEMPEQPEEQPEQPETDPELDTPEESDASYAGSVVVVGDRAMEIPTRLDDLITSYAGAVGNLAAAMGPDVRTISLITPNGGEFYSPESLHTGEHSQKDMIEFCYSQMNDKIVTVDAYSKLRSHTDEYIYFRTDHHWTTEAAYYVYAAWAEEKGLSPLALSDYKKKTLTDGFFGTVDAKVGGRNRSDTIHVYIPKKKEKYQVNYVAKNETADDIYQYDYLKIRDKYSVYFGGNQSLVEVKTDSKSKRKLLVVQDSYAHCFIPFTLHDFKEVDFVDLRYYSESLKEYMEKGDYTDVLFLYNAAGFAEDNSLIKLGN